MKRIFALVMTLCLFCAGVVFAEKEPAEDKAAKDNGSLNLTSLPERKTINSLEDVLTAQDATRLQKAVSDALISYAEKDTVLTDRDWSQKLMQEKMHNASQGRIAEIAEEIQATLKATDEQKKSLEQAVQQGESKKSWLDGRFKQYITKAIELTGDTPKITGNGRNAGFTIAGKNWRGQALSEKEAQGLRDKLEADQDNGIKTAVAVGLVIAEDNGQVGILNQAGPRQLTMIAINAVEEAKTVLKVKKGLISGKEGVAKLTDTAMASVIGMLAGFDYKQIGFIAGTAAGTAAGGALEGATGGLSLGVITINGALLGAYLGEKIGSKLGDSLNATMDEKLKVRIITEFESFIGGTVASVLNIQDVQKALDSMDKESDIKLTEEAAKAMGKAKDGAVSFGHSVGDTLSSWGKAIGNAFSSLGHSISSGIQSAGHWLGDLFHSMGQAIGEGWNGLGQWFNTLFHSVKRAFNDASFMITVA